MKNSERRFREVKAEMELINDSFLKMDYLEESIYHYKSCKDNTVFTLNRSLWLFYNKLICSLVAYRAELLVKKDKAVVLKNYINHKKQLTFNI